jgi:hypothetical protein
MTVRLTHVRYTVHPGREEQNAELVRAVYLELGALAPPGFRYSTYRFHEGRTFVHVAEQDDDGSPGPLATLPAFRAFQAAIAERCEEGPVVEQAEVVGRYGG